MKYTSAYSRMLEAGAFETTVTDELRAFLAQIDTAFIATTSGDGQPYVQHRGGPKGFIRALDDQHLAWVELKGNRQFMSLGNLGENDRVALILMDYARRQRVKVWGTARVEQVDGQTIVVITVSHWDINCPKAIPVKLDAADVATALDALKARIAQLEAENAELRARAAG